MGWRLSVARNVSGWFSGLSEMVTEVARERDTGTLVGVDDESKEWSSEKRNVLPFKRSSSADVKVWSSV